MGKAGRGKVAWGEVTKEVNSFSFYYFYFVQLFIILIVFIIGLNNKVTFYSFKLVKNWFKFNFICQLIVKRTVSIYLDPRCIFLKSLRLWLT